MTKAIRAVLFTNSHAELGGGEMALLAHMRHLRAQGVRVAAILLDSGPLKAEIEALGGSVAETSFAWQGSKARSFLLILRRVLDFLRLIRKQAPDLVVSYTYNDFIFAGLACRLNGTPIIYRAQGEVFPDGKPGGGWLGRRFPAFVELVGARILCTTDYEARNMIKAGVPANMVKTIHLGVAGNPPQPTSPPNKPRPCVGIVGRLVRWKGQHVFVQAIGELARRGVDADAWIVGGSSFGDGDEYERELAALIAQYGIEERAKLLGFRRDVAELMQRCDVVCHCSSFEPFGLVIVEAMMAGKPVVASDVSGPRESVVDGKTGFLVAPGDPLALADRLQLLLNDADLRDRLGHAGRARAEENFELERNLHLIDEEGQRLLTAPNTGGRSKH